MGVSMVCGGRYGEARIGPKPEARPTFEAQKAKSGVRFLPCDASAERGDATVSRLSVRPSVWDVQVQYLMIPERHRQTISGKNVGQ